MMNLLKRERDFFDSLFDEFSSSPFLNKETMKTDIKETDTGYELAIELPGFDKQDVKVSMDNGYLLIEAERKSEKEDKQASKYIKRERYYGMMKRSFYVGDVSLSDIKGNFTDGILKLDIPKENKKIETKRYLELE
ncbi:MAG: molecular chaperone Hsp20 [Tenericutes bacterium HGW-Tenericutes-8]|nr:MAG: molecular chaperone Hsp20 [Tenericutes bacterium HGW-Tenericutes-8]